MTALLYTEVLGSSFHLFTFLQQANRQHEMWAGIPDEAEAISNTVKQTQQSHSIFHELYSPLGVLHSSC